MSMSDGEKPIHNQKIFSIPEVAKAVGRSLPATRQAIERGQLPARRWGRRVVVLSNELDDFLRTLPFRTKPL
jgi:excisionase family DNA binding protein